MGEDAEFFEMEISVADSGAGDHLQIQAIMRNGHIHALRSVIGLEVAQSAVGDNQIGRDGERRLLGA